MANLAIIPARGGSKRIPKKNIKYFLGKPIIHYSINTALESQLFDRVIVSTDDYDIAQYAKSLGAEVPFIRPANLADDYTGTHAVVAHALMQCADDGGIDYACCLYPTSPLLSKATLIEGYALLQAKKCDFVVSACEFDFPIQRAISVDANGCVCPDNNVAMLARSQDLPPRYHDAGQFYWGSYNAFTRHKNLWDANTHAITIPASLVQDIDTEEDWLLAEIKYKHAYIDNHLDTHRVK